MGYTKKDKAHFKYKFAIHIKDIMKLSKYRCKMIKIFLKDVLVDFFKIKL